MRHQVSQFAACNLFRRRFPRHHAQCPSLGKLPRDCRILGAQQIIVPILPPARVGRIRPECNLVRGKPSVTQMGVQAVLNSSGNSPARAPVIRRRNRKFPEQARFADPGAAGGIFPLEMEPNPALREENRPDSISLLTPSIRPDTPWSAKNCNLRATEGAPFP